MSKFVIGLDQSYTCTGLTLLEDDKKILAMENIDFKGCHGNTDKRETLVYILRGILRDSSIDLKNMIIITERIRLISKGVLSETYIKSTAAMIACIIDLGRRYKVPVYSVDTRSWKSAIVGTSKPIENNLGISPEKYPTILYMKNQGLLDRIVKEYNGRGTKGILTMRDKKSGQMKKYKILDDVADSYCIAKYGFLPEKKRKLQEEIF